MEINKEDRDEQGIEKVQMDGGIEETEINGEDRDQKRGGDED